MPDKWTQFRGPLDPTSSPASSFSPTLSPASSPRSPGSPTVTWQLNKFGDLALGNGQSILSGISPQPTGSPLHQSLLDGGNNTSCADILRPVLGPSFTRRTQASSADSFPSTPPTVVPTTSHHHMSTAWPDKNGSEYRDVSFGTGSQAGDQPTHPMPHAPMLPEDRRLLEIYGLGNFPPEFECGLFDEFKSTPADIANSTTHVDSAANDPAFGVGFPLHLAPSFLPLTEPHKHQPDYYSQHAPVEPIAGCSGSKHSDSKAKVLKYYFENFKHNQPFLRVCDQQFKMQVGSLKTSQASMKKRDDPDGGHWTCPLLCTDFTRKQNLKLHIQSHLGIKGCECTCGTTFNAHSGLKRHQKKCRNFLSDAKRVT